MRAPDLMTVKQVAQRLNISTRQVYSLVERGFFETATQDFGPWQISSAEVEIKISRALNRPKPREIQGNLRGAA